jgi:DHA1 family tetracycline resistance protein-like MFS transporter
MPPRKSSLLVIFLTVFIDLLGFGMVLPLLPIYGQQFARQFNLAETSDDVGLLIGLLMSSFSLMQFLFAPIWGRLSDRIGRRPVLMIGLAGSVVFYTIFGIATAMQSIAGLFVARIGAGIAGATISTAQAYIADVTTHGERAKGMALIGAAFGIGFTFGPLVGWLALAGGDGEPGPGPGYAAAVLSAIALALAWYRLPESLSPASRPEPRSWLNFTALAEALAVPSVGLLLLTSFICLFAFANFESTVSLLLRNDEGPFRYSDRDIMLVFAYIGLVLTLAQGLLVRRLAGKIGEGTMAASGALVQIGGFLLLRQSIHAGGQGLLVALAAIVVGFALLTPAIISLVSRRTSPTKQGGVLGVLQSANSLARIFGPMAGARLFYHSRLATEWDVPAATLPIYLAAALMCVGLILVLVAASRGRDYTSL